MSWEDVYGYDGDDFPDYEPDYSFGDEGLDNEPDYTFGDEGLDYEPDYTFGDEGLVFEPEYSFGNDVLGNEAADYSFGNAFPDCEPDYVAAIKSPSSSTVASGKTPSEKRKVMKKALNNPNDKRSKSASQKAATKVSLRKSTSKKFEKKPGSEPKKTVKFDVPTKNNPKKPQLSNKEPQKNQQPSSKHRKTPKRDLAGAIRKFSASKVKIPKEDTKWARKMADTHIEFVRGSCQEKWKGIFNHFEFTGSFYEHLKTEAANELDILVALDTKNDADLVVEDVPGVPGYALIKVTKQSSKYCRFADSNGYVRPKKVRSKFFGVVQQAVNEYKKKKGEKDPVLKPSDNGPATKLLIDDKEAKKKLEVDLVPAFLFKTKKDSPLSVPEGRHYVAKQLPEQMIIPNMKCTREMLWRQSFSLEEKKKMENLDKKDSGCRREVVKVMKTIVKNDSTLAKLSSYHVKTAFLHYNFDEGQENLDWSVKDMAERLKGLMEYLRQSISDKNLSHFFIKDLNLLKELKDSSLENIEGRLKKLITSESELRRVLAVQPEESNEGQGQGKVEAKKAKKKPKKSTRQRQAAKSKPHKAVGLNSKSRVKSNVKNTTLEADVMQIIAAILRGHQL